MTAPRSVCGIVLAAGASRRAGGIKALAEIDGRPLVSIICETLLAGGCERVVVVLGPPHQAGIERALAGRYPVVTNPRPELGMLHSLQLALAAIEGASAAVVALVDHPGVSPETVAALIHAHQQGGGAWLRPEYQGQHGHPFLIDRSAFDAIAAAEPTAITRDVLSQAAESQLVPVDDPAVIEDLDTPEALARLGARIPSNRT